MNRYASRSACRLARLSTMFLMDLSAWADTAAERLDESATVLSEVMGASDKGIPQDLLEDAHCVITVPSVKKAAFYYQRKVRKRLCRLQK